MPNIVAVYVATISLQYIPDLPNSWDHEANPTHLTQAFESEHAAIAWVNRATASFFKGSTLRADIKDIRHHIQKDQIDMDQLDPYYTDYYVTVRRTTIHEARIRIEGVTLTNEDEAADIAEDRANDWNVSKSTFRKNAECSIQVLTIEPTPC